MNVENLGPVAPGSVIVFSIPDLEFLADGEPEAWYRTLGEQFGHIRFALVIVVPPPRVRVLAAEEDLAVLVADLLAAGGIPGAGVDVVDPAG